MSSLLALFFPVPPHLSHSRNLTGNPTTFFSPFSFHTNQQKFTHNRLKARSEALWHLQGFIPRKFAKHDGKAGEGEGGTPPFFCLSPRMMEKWRGGMGVSPPFFRGSSRMMGKSKRGDTIHPPRHLLVIGHPTYGTWPFFLYKTEPLHLQI